MAKPKAKTLQQKLGFFDEDLKRPEHDDIIKWTDKNLETILFKLYNLENWSEKTKNDLIEKVEKIKIKELSEEKDLLKKLKSELEDKFNLLKESKKGLEKNPEAYWRKSEVKKMEEEYNEKKINIEQSEKKIIYIENFEGLGNNLPKRNKPRIIERIWEYTVTNQSYNQRTGYKSTKNIIGFVDMKVNFIYNRLTVTGIDFENKKIIGKIKWTQTEKHYKSWEEKLLNHNIYIEVKTKITTLGELFRQLNTYKEYLKGDFLVICPDDSEKETIENQGFKFIKYE